MVVAIHLFNAGCSNMVSPQFYRERRVGTSKCILWDCMYDFLGRMDMDLGFVRCEFGRIRGFLSCATPRMVGASWCSWPTSVSYTHLTLPTKA